MGSNVQEQDGRREGRGQGGGSSGPRQKHGGETRQKAASGDLPARALSRISLLDLATKPVMLPALRLDDG